MKVLLITVRSDFGGGPRHVDQLVDNLSDDFELYLAYPKDGKPYGIKWDDDVLIKERFYIPYRRFSPLVLIKLSALVYREKIDIIHSHGNGAGIYSRLLKILCPKVKVVHTFHGISDIYSSKVKYYMSLLIGRILAPMADKYIAVSNGEKNMSLLRHFSKANNTIVIYNGIDNNIITKENKSSNIIQFITLSRFDYQKNMSLMYRIAKKVNNLPIHFVWVGDGDDRNKLEMEAKEDNLKISFTGFTEKPMDYLCQADWYISTSRFEGLPYALIEASSIGLPILATNVKGNNEVVKNGYNGFLFNTEEEAIEIIKDIVDGKMDYRCLSNNSVNYYRENFTLEIMIRKIEQVYLSLLIS